MAAGRKGYTKAQLEMVRTLAAQHPGWHRAQCHGDRVTLASLYYRGLAERQVHSGVGTSSPAHEYRLRPETYDALAAAVLRKRQEQN